MTTGQHQPDCEFSPDHLGVHPCGRRDGVGKPCGVCGKPQEVWPCPDCSQPITIADFKAWMAEEGFDTVVTPPTD